MADVRALLRLERQNRRITHPQASYFPGGKLFCNICNIPIKSDNAWQGHLHSKQHALLLKEQLSDTANGSALISPPHPSRKRKASPSETFPEEDRKRVRTFSELDSRLAEVKTLEGATQRSIQQDTKDSSESETEAELAELESFERELATLESSTSIQAPAGSLPTISAPPKAEGELQADALEAAPSQREKRLAEIEAEKEDAAKLLDNELEELEDLEQRVKRLRERRDQIRTAQISDGHQDPIPPLTEITVPSHKFTNVPREAIRENNENAQDSSDEESDVDFDEWTFGHDR